MNGDLEDGFPKSASWSRFDACRLWQSNQSRILHLHGSISYGYPPLSHQDPFVDFWDDLCKYQAFQEAVSTWFGRSTNTAQSHEEAVIGPLITGLRKPDKLTVHPYDEYQAVFRNALRGSPRLLVVGYSFGDLYLNSIINRMFAWHGPKRRIVVVTWFPREPETWHYEPGVSDWPTMDMYYALSMATNSDGPLGRSLVYKDKLFSADGCCRIYLGGTKGAFEKYGEEILDFVA